jgi:AcrR family transcriptional regulator
MSVTTKRLRPRKTPVQARSVETRDRILDAAARVFSAHGYAAGTTNRIAAEAELSVGSLYQYFPNKDAVLVELVRRHVASGTQHIEEMVAAARPGSLREWIEVLVDAMVANHRDDPALHQVLFEEAPRPPELLAEVHALEERAVAVVASVLRTLPEVRVADVDAAARFVVVTVESLVHRVVATRAPALSIETFRDQLVTMLVRYLAPA